jgi:serine phosphatase RsbU (regulator of sigma subunit)
VLRAVLSGHEPVVANNLARVQNFQVDFSMASDSSHFSAVACPLDWDADSVDAIYVILPPTLGSLEWLMLISLAVEQYRHANAAWSARLSIESRAAIDHEMKLAQKIQAATLPAVDPAISLDWAVRFEPCRSVGGDYVDIFRRPDNSVILLIADAAGKGLQAALITSGLHAVFHTLGRNDCPLAEVVSAADRYLHAYLPDGSFVTLCAVLLDPISGEGACVNCGHPPILALHPSGGPREIAGGGNLPLALCDGTIETGNFRLEPGEWLIGYTDGLSEMFNDKQEMLGADSLARELVRQCAAIDCDAGQLADRINAWLDGFRGPAPVSDDRTFLVARRRGQAAEEM